MPKLLLSETYPFEAKKTITDTHERIIAFFGGGVEILERTETENSDLMRKEDLTLSNGHQLTLIVEAKSEEKELEISVYRRYNPKYLEQLTEEDIDLLCALAVQRSFEFFSIEGMPPLTKEDHREEEQLSYLIPKLMIAAGQATTANF